jgi:hypothetical protein
VAGGSPAVATRALRHLASDGFVGVASRVGHLRVTSIKLYAAAKRAGNGTPGEQRAARSCDWRPPSHINRSQRGCCLSRRPHTGQAGRIKADCASQECQCRGIDVWDQAAEKQAIRYSAAMEKPKILTARELRAIMPRLSGWKLAKQKLSRTFDFRISSSHSALRGGPLTALGSEPSLIARFARSFGYLPPLPSLRQRRASDPVVALPVWRVLGVQALGGGVRYIEGVRPGHGTQPNE